MNELQSIRAYLIDHDPDYEKVFQDLENAAELVFSENSDRRYRYPSAVQTVGHLKEFSRVANSGDINQENIAHFFSENNDQIATTMRLFLYEKGRAPDYLAVFTWTRRAVVSKRSINPICKRSINPVLQTHIPR